MAMKMFEDKQRKEGTCWRCLHNTHPFDRTVLTQSTGQAVSHGFAKELLAGFAGAEVDRLAETKGADYIDREKAKHEAKKRAEHLYDEHYGNNYDQYDPNQHEAPGHLQDTFGRENFGRGGGDSYGGGRDNYGGGRDNYGGGREQYGGGRDQYDGGREQYGGGRGNYGGRDNYGGDRY